MDECRIVNGSNNTTIKIWNLPKQSTTYNNYYCDCTLVREQILDTRLDILLECDNNSIIRGSYDSTIKIWNILTKTCDFTFDVIGIVTIITIFPNGKILVITLKLFLM